MLCRPTGRAMADLRVVLRPRQRRAGEGESREAAERAHGGIDGPADGASDGRPAGRAPPPPCCVRVPDGESDGRRPGSGCRAPPPSVRSLPANELNLPTCTVLIQKYEHPTYSHMSCRILRASRPAPAARQRRERACPRVGPDEDFFLIAGKSSPGKSRFGQANL